jgi:hypothetical protein
MPVPPAELTAHFTIEGPPEARGAALDAVAPSGLAREAGPDELMLAGARETCSARWPTPCRRPSTPGPPGST